jgi:hypothetical protein
MKAQVIDAQFEPVSDLEVFARATLTKLSPFLDWQNDQPGGHISDPFFWT